MNNVIQFLSQHNIDFILHEHPPVYTCEEAEEYCVDIPGISCKNLFLRTKNDEQFFLLIIPADKKADLKKFAYKVGEKKVTFSSVDSMKSLLGLDPGSVSPFGLINDTENKVKLCIDTEVYNTDIVSFHPNVNTATLELSRDMFRRYLSVTNHEVHVIEL